MSHGVHLAMQRIKWSLSVVCEDAADNKLYVLFRWMHIIWSLLI